MRARRTAGQVAAMLEAESLWDAALWAAAVSGTGMEMSAALGMGVASLWAAALGTGTAADGGGGAGRPE